MHFFTKRLFIVSFAIFIQISIIFIGIYFLGSRFSSFYIFTQILGIIVVFWIGSKNDNPAYKLTWTVFILIFPLVGTFCYIFWGNKRLPGKVKKASIAMKSKIEDYNVSADESLSDLMKSDTQSGICASYLQNTAGFPVYRNSIAKYYSLGEHFYSSLLDYISKADDYIMMEYFIIEDGTMWNGIHTLLKRKIKSGVDVYLIYDDVGCINTLPKNYDSLLRNEGFHVHIMNPYKPRINPSMNYRDHRKITVIDGKIAFCGGVNLADEYINEKNRFGIWKDMAIRIEGEGVRNFIFSFCEMWNFSTLINNYNDKLLEFNDFYTIIPSSQSDGFVQPFSDTPLDYENVGENFFLNAINKAERYIYITTPYLVIDNEMQTSLCLAAKNGIDVHIITPGIPDKKIIYQLTKSYYKPLLEAGVKISEYSKGFIHGKTLVVDDKIALVGTFNLDYRSFYFHFECGIALYHCSSIKHIKDDIDNTIHESMPVSLMVSRRNNLGERFIRMVLRMFAPLL